MPELQFGVFRDVLIGPAVSSKPIYAGGLVNPLKYPRFCRHNRRGRPVNASTSLTGHLLALTDEEGRPFVFGGVYQSHFGHCIAEFVHRLWILQKPEYAGCTVLFVARSAHLPPAPYFEDLMRYLGVEKWCILDQPHLVPELVIAQQGKEIKRKAHAEYMSFLAHRATRNGLFKSDLHDKVAFLRGHMQSRRLLGEQHLAEYLSKQGYLVYRPEQHPIKHQLQTLSNAKRVVISDGSACHLFDLLPPIDAEVFFLSRNKRATIAKTSIRWKVRKLHVFNDVISLIIPNNKEGMPQKTRGLLYACLEEVVERLKEAGFVDPEAEPIESTPYFEDMRAYVESRALGLGKAISSNDIAIELLANRIHESALGHCGKLVKRISGVWHSLRKPMARTPIW